MAMDFHPNRKKSDSDDHDNNYACYKMMVLINITYYVSINVWF